MSESTKLHAIKSKHNNRSLLTLKSEGTKSLRRVRSVMRASAASAEMSSRVTTRDTTSSTTEPTSRPVWNEGKNSTYIQRT